MSDIFITIITIMAVALLLFIFPLISVTSQNETITEMDVQALVSTFANTVSKEGKITEANYDEFIQKLYATGNAYSIEIEVQILDNTLCREGTDKYVIGECLYYSEFTSVIEKELRENGQYDLKQGDYIKVKVKNTNETFGTQLKRFLYGAIGKEETVIDVSSASAMIGSGPDSGENPQNTQPGPPTPPPQPPVNPGTIIEIRYHANIEVGGIVTGVSGVPEKQTATSGVPVLIAEEEPTVTTNSETEKYVFAGWSTSADSNTIRYTTGEQATFYADTDLYAVWRISFEELEWTKDYYWKYDNQPWKIEGYSTKAEDFLPPPRVGIHRQNAYKNMVDKNIISNGVFDGSISRIRIKEGTNGANIDIIGNSIWYGKGATWTTVSQETEVKEIQFNFSGRRGDSISASGVMFNVEESADKIEGYILSINFGEYLLGRTFGISAPHSLDYTEHLPVYTIFELINNPALGNEEKEAKEKYKIDKSKYEQEVLKKVREKLGNNSIQRKDLTGAIFKFTYYKGNSIGDPSINTNLIEELRLIDVFDVGLPEEAFTTNGGEVDYTSSQYSINEALIRIKVTENGYTISSEAFPVGKEIVISVNNIKPNTFGFFSEHYEHGCKYIGHVKIENVRVIAD